MNEALRERLRSLMPAEQDERVLSGFRDLGPGTRDSLAAELRPAFDRMVSAGKIVATNEYKTLED